MATPTYGPTTPTYGPTMQTRIGALQRRIKQRPGPNDNLRQKLSHLRGLSFAQKSRHEPPATMPWDTAYETRAGIANRDYAFAQGQAEQQRSSTNINYGINDPTNNPYSRAKLLESAYAQSVNRTGTSYAASGQLYAGSTQNALNTDRTNFNVSQDQLLKAYQAAQDSITNNLSRAGLAKQDALSEAELQRIQDAINSPLDPSASPPPPKSVKNYRNQLQQRLQGAKPKQREHIKNLLDRLRLHG